MSDCKDFSGKVVIITGSTSGMGEGIATYLSSLGANVVINGRNEKKVKTVTERLCKLVSKQKQKVIGVAADVTKEKDLKKLLNETIDKFGKLDVLVNNAGVSQVTTYNDPNLMQAYETIMNTNVKAVLHLSTLAVPYLQKTKGCIVNVSSICGLKPTIGFLVYCMAKTAIDMMTKTLALELGPLGIRINSINPSAVRTPLYDKFGIESFNIENIEKISALSYPLGRIGEPIDCAKAVAFLVSNDSSFISGMQMLVDGAALYANLIVPRN